MYKKILSGLLALSMVAPAFANVTSAGGTSSVPVELNAAATSFSVTVPTALPVDVAADGSVTVNQNNSIINNSFGPIEVKGAKIETANGWTLKDFNTDFAKAKVNAKEFAFQLNSQNVATDGSVSVTGFTPIDGLASQKFTYDAKIAPQAKQLSTQQIANVVFTLGWVAESEPLPDHATGSPVDKSTMAEHLGMLSGTIQFSRERAPKSADVPLNSDSTVLADIQGQDATVYSRDGGGVFAPVDCQYLFYNIMDESYYASELDVSGLDTSQVTDMNSMFSGSVATTITGLSSFDTSRVTDMNGMFSLSAATTLDLSSFDTSKVEDVSYMFSESSATTVYCRTQEDLQRMQSSSSCTATGFVVGHPQ